MCVCVGGGSGVGGWCGGGEVGGVWGQTFIPNSVGVGVGREGNKTE